MKTNLLLFGCLLSTLLAQSQKVQWGPELKTKKSFVVTGILHGDKDAIYVQKAKINVGQAIGAAYANMFSFGAAHATVHSTAFIEKYDNKFNLAFSKDFTTAIKDYAFERLIWTKDRMLVFSSKYDKEGKTNSAYSNVLDKSGDLKDKSNKLMTLEVEKKSRRGGFDYEFSQDTSKILLYAYPPYEKDQNQKIAFRVYDNDMKPIWSKDVTMPYKDKLIVIKDYLVTNDGDVYVLVKHYDNENVFLKESKKEEGEKVANYKYEILSYSKEESGKTFVLDLGGKFVDDATIDAGNDGNIAFAGFYCEKLYGSLKGIFYTVIDKTTRQTLTSSTKEFSADILNEFGKREGDKKKSKGDSGLRNFDFRHFIHREDGGAVILAENYYVTEVTTTDPKTGRTTTHYYYHYNDIIAINISPKGSIEWFTRIPKKQVSGAPGGLLSYQCMVNSNINLIYNDNRDNEDKKDAKVDKLKYFNPRKAATVLVTLDNAGKFTKKNLFELKDLKVYPIPTMCKQINKNTMILYSQRGKKYKFGSLTVD